MKKILLLVLAALFFPAYSSAEFYVKSVSQIPAKALEKVSFEDKEALLKEMESLRDNYLDAFSHKVLMDAFEEFNKRPDVCEAEDQDIVTCIIHTFRRIRIPELFSAHPPRNYSGIHFGIELEEAKTKDEFLERTIFPGREEDKHLERLAQRYKTAFEALADTFTQVERSLPQPRLTSQQENALWEKLDGKLGPGMTAAERDMHRKVITTALVKAKVAEIIQDLRPYQSALFDSILINNPQREKIAREAINSLIKLNRKELDKTIKEALSGFDKQIKG